MNILGILNKICKECLCRICTGYKCPRDFRNRCLGCRIEKPTMECDFFENKYIKQQERVKKCSSVKVVRIYIPRMNRTYRRNR